RERTHQQQNGGRKPADGLGPHGRPPPKTEDERGSDMFLRPNPGLVEARCQCSGMTASSRMDPSVACAPHLPDPPLPGGEEGEKQGATTFSHVFPSLPRGERGQGSEGAGDAVCSLLSFRLRGLSILMLQGGPVMTSRRFRILPAAGIAFGLFLAPALPLLAQEPAPEESFAEAIDVSVVNLDVFVTDRKGQPLSGLTREDFEIYEDGKPVEITNFYAESGVAVVPARDASGPGTAQAPPARPPEQQLRLVIFVDDANTVASGRAKILDRL